MKTTPKAMKRKGNSKTTNEDQSGFSPLYDLRFLRVPASTSKEEAWLSLMGRVSCNEKIPSTNLFTILPLRYIAIAATVALVLASYYFIVVAGYHTVSTKNGEMASAYLPDSSIVYLNSGTTIRFNINSWHENREVMLEGEAFFKVKAGSKFSVVTLNSITSVLGTSFNVYARGKEVRVSCITGKVLVTSKYSGDSKLLLPGFRTRVAENMLAELKETNLDHEAKWVDGKFYFQQENLRNVLDELERQYSIKIIYSVNENRTYTGFFTNKDLMAALDLVCIPMQLHYRKLNAQTIQIY